MQGSGDPSHDDVFASPIESLDAAVRSLFEPPVRVACAEAFADVDDLFPEERSAVERAIPRRQREYATSRVLARRLLDDLGRTSAPIVSREDRSPVWPEGFTGSISHTHGICVAVVSPLGEVRALGVDVERRRELTPRHAEMIMTPAERAHTDEATAAGQTSADLIVFSAKEAVYKAQHPLTGTFLGFQDVGDLPRSKAADLRRTRPPGRGPCGPPPRPRAVSRR